MHYIPSFYRTKCTPRAVWSVGRLIGFGLLLVTALGCVRLPRSQPKAEVKSLQREDAFGSLTPTALQAAVMRFADEYSLSVAEAADLLAVRVGTPEARYVAVRLKLGQGTAAIINASGPNPAVNALDLVVLASVSRMVAEDYLVGEVFGEAGMPILETYRRLETNAWSLIKPVLKPEQLGELRELIDEWRRKHPKQVYVGAVRFREFVEAIGRTPQQSAAKSTSVFSLLFLDPMAGLDPTLRAVEEARYFAERTLYYGQRMPVLLTWQAEVLGLRLADQPAARQVLTNFDTWTTSLQVFAKTAEQFPQVINQQREAAIQQLFAGVAAERSNIVANFVAEEKTLHGLLADTRGTLKAAEETATAANAAIQSLNTFMRIVSPPKTNVVAGPARTNARPFNVLDYGTAAGQVGEMARDLNTLLTSANQNASQVAQLGQKAAADIQSTVRLGFWLALLLLVILLAGAVVAGLSYRILAHKLASHQQRSPPG